MERDFRGYLKCGILAHGFARIRFGASLNTHFHFHVLVLDGVVCEEGHGQVQFHEASRLQPHDWELLHTTDQRRVLRDHLLRQVVPATATASWTRRSPRTCSRGRPPAGSASTRRSAPRAPTATAWSASHSSSLLP
ncbi:MAG: hypothetical protein EA351_05495, partial [Gemmatimonadales bacterium]